MSLLILTHNVIKNKGQMTKDQLIFNYILQLILDFWMLQYFLHELD